MAAKLDAASVLCALYNNAHAQGMGWFQFDPAPLTRQGALEIFEKVRNPRYDDFYFDYLKGRVMKVLIPSDGVLLYQDYTCSIDLRSYNHDNGAFAGENAILDYFTDPNQQS